MKKSWCIPDRIDIFLKADIDALLKSGQLVSVGAAEEQSPNFNLGAKNISSLTEKFIFPVKNKGDKVLNVNVISNGDPLEIYTSNDGEVIFKKYSPVGELTEGVSQAAEVISKLGNAPAVIFDRDHVVAVAGAQKKEYSERRNSPALEDILETRKSYFWDENTPPLLLIEGIESPAIAAAPIISAGDVIGAVAFIKNSDDIKPEENHSLLVKAAAMFLGKSIEG